MLWRGNHRGVLIAGRAAPILRENVIRGNVIGLLLRDRAAPQLEANTVAGNQQDLVEERNNPR